MTIDNDKPPNKWRLVRFMKISLIAAIINLITAIINFLKIILRNRK